MTLLSEKKNFVRLHAIAQGMNKKRCKVLLEEIQEDEDWQTIWQREAIESKESEDMLGAVQLYNLAKFPFQETKTEVDDSVACFDVWRQSMESQGVIIEHKHILVNDTGLNQHANVAYYLRCIDKNAPTLFVIGGIVSTKEQWHIFLQVAEQLGVNVVVTEMPGVGENDMIYHPESYTMISAILDDIAPFSDKVHVVGMSFGGHMAIQAATEDERIVGISTVGAPLHHFFLDEKWWQTVPSITKHTLAHLCQKTPEELQTCLAEFALSSEQLSSLKTPVYYIQSSQDEIIPNDEVDFLTESVRKAYIKQFNDIHGSPNHMPIIRSYIPFTALKTLNIKWVLQCVLSAKWRVQEKLLAL